MPLWLNAVINSRYPLPNDLSGGNGVNTGVVRWNAPNNRDDKIYTTIDNTPNNNHRIFGRLTMTRRDSTNALQFYPGDPDSVLFKDESFSFAAGHSWIINSKLTNTFTAGASVSKFFFTPPSGETFPQSYTFGGISSPFPSLSYQDRNVYTPVFRDDVTFSKGNHTIFFGASFKPIRQDSTLTNDFNFVTVSSGGVPALPAALRPANIGSGTALTAYDAMFSFMLGRISAVSTGINYAPDGSPLAPGSGKKRSYWYNEYEFYVQDNWRIRTDLTLNLGVRYHLYPAPYERNGFQADHTTDFQALMALRVANNAAGISGPGAEPLLSYSLSGKKNSGVPFYDTDKNNFAPRVGFAWNPSFRGGLLGGIFGDRKTVLRGNYSKVYDRVGGAITFIQNQVDYLFNNSAALSFGNLSDPILALTTAPRFIGPNTIPGSAQPTPPAATRPFVPFATNGTGFGLGNGELNYTIDKKFQIPEAHTFNFGIQREIPGNMLIDVAYVGRLGRKLFTQTDTSQALNFRDPVSGQFLFDALNAMQPIVAANIANGLPGGTGVPAQPWFENQSGTGITGVVANALADLVAGGGTADIISILAFNNLLDPNVAMSSQFAANLYISNQGNSDYHGMLVSLQKRLSRGFEFDINYTWSHSLDNNSSVVNTISGGSVCDFTNLRACRANSDFDIRHLFNTNFIWDIPVGRGRAFGGNMNRWADAVIGGWTFSGIVSLRSGLAINSASGYWGVRYWEQTPSILQGNPSAFQSNIRDVGNGIQYFADPEAARAALRSPRHGEIGTRNIFRSPMYWNIDFGLGKKFTMPWSEKHFLTIRADAFNLTNTNHFAFPSLTLNSPNTFGILGSSISSPREIQFAIRYDF